MLIGKEIKFFLIIVHAFPLLTVSEMDAALGGNLENLGDGSNGGNYVFFVDAAPRFSVRLMPSRSKQ